MGVQNKKYIYFIILIAVTMIVVVCGVLFSAREFFTYCYNEDDGSLDKDIQVLLKNQCENQSVFMIDEQALKDKIQTDFPQVEVLNVERIFPNKVKLNYIYKKTYAYVVTNGMYKYFSKDGKVACIDGGEKSTTCNVIRVVVDEKVEEGDYLFLPTSESGNKIHILLDMMELMQIKNIEDLIEEIDLSCLKSDFMQIKMREGAVVNIEYPSRNYSQKIRLFASAITSCEKTKREKGVWRVYSNKISYAKN